MNNCVDFFKYMYIQVVEFLFCSLELYYHFDKKYLYDKIIAT